MPKRKSYENEITEEMRATFEIMLKDYKESVERGIMRRLISINPKAAKHYAELGETLERINRKINRIPTQDQESAQRLAERRLRLVEKKMEMDEDKAKPQEIKIVFGDPDMERMAE